MTIKNAKKVEQNIEICFIFQIYQDIQWDLVNLYRKSSKSICI